MNNLNELSTLRYRSIYILSEHTDISIELSDSLLTTFMHRSLFLLIVGIPGYDMRLVRVAAVRMCGQ